MNTKPPKQSTDDEIRSLFPIYDCGYEPPVQVIDLIVEIEQRLSDSEDIPFMAFVTGPGMNYRVEFNDYDAGRHETIVSEGLMELIRRGADRIVVIAEVWFRNSDGTPDWHGVMIFEATASGDISYTAEFEGQQRVAEWSSGSAGDSGNLERLFERARM